MLTIFIFFFKSCLSFCTTSVHSSSSSSSRSSYTRPTSTRVMSTISSSSKTNTILPESSTKSTLKPTQTNKIEKYVFWNGDDFILDGDVFIPVGFNAYWLGYTEEYTYPLHSQIEEVFKIANKMGATVIRSHTLGFSGGSQRSLRPFNNNLNLAAWEPIDYAFYMARKYNIRLIIPLIDGYDYYHGSYGEFCKTRGVDKTQFWVNMDVRADFKDYIKQWLNHVNRYTGISIKQDPYLFLIELGNELGNIRPNVGSTTIPTEDWIRDISSWIKMLDPNHLVLNGADESLGQSNEFNINTLDVYSGHFYGKDYNRIDDAINNVKRINKAYIIGEYGSNFEEDWFMEIERRQGVKGTVVWSFYYHDNGLSSGNRVEHNDGFTLYGDNASEENNKKVLRITNHIRRMRGLQTVSSLIF